jgi:Icc-related predicted phosphoesterase
MNNEKQEGKMRVDYCSDLHLEFGNVELPGGEVLVLAGDVCEERKVNRHRRAWNELTAEEQLDPKYIELYRCWTFFLREVPKYKKVFMVMGNHEHYHGKFHKTRTELLGQLPDNVELLENEAVEYEGVVFMGATLWTNCNNGDSLTTYTLRASMNDYRVIQNFYEDKSLYFKLTPEWTFRTHIKTMNYFREELPKHSDKPVVVITHHAPSFMSISEQYRGPGDYHMNGGYASDLSEFILDHPQIKKWVHGHVHSTHQYNIGDTEVLANPRGYVGHEAIANHFEVKHFEI